MEQFESDRKVFLESFPGWKTFQTFDDVKERQSRKLIYQASTKENQYPIDGEVDYTIPIIPVKIIMDLEARNAYKACCSLTINETNGKGRKTTDITRVRAVWADFDGVKLPKKWDAEPSIILETSPGKYHAYWLTSPEDKYSVPLDAFTTIQEGISMKYSSDEFVKDLPKAMRMPGFYHNKKEPFLSRVLEHTGNVYEFGLLVATFPPRQRETWSSEKYKDAGGIASDGEFKGTYGAPEGGRNHFLCKRIGGCIKRGLTWPQIEQEAFREAEACTPPLPEYEVKAILKSLRRY